MAPILNRFRRQQHRYLRVTPDGNALRRVAQMVEAGQIDPIIEKVYELDDIRNAHTRNESGRVVGKLALRVARPNEDHAAQRKTEPSAPDGAGNGIRYERRHGLVLPARLMARRPRLIPS
jgi:hypothetical protein